MGHLVRSLMVLAVVLAMGIAPKAAYDQNVVEGQFLLLDSGAKRLVIRTDAGSQMQFEYTSQTVVNGSDEGLSGLRARKGALVTVTYEKQEARLLALEVHVHALTS